MFKLRWKETLLIYKNSRNFMNMAVRNFFFKSLLTALIVENSHNLIEIYFIFLTKRQWEGWKSSSSSTTFSTYICKISCSNVTLKLGQSLSVTKIFKQIKLEGVWGNLEARTFIQRQSLIKYLRRTLLFMQNSALRQMFNFRFAWDYY